MSSFLFTETFEIIIKISTFTTKSETKNSGFWKEVSFYNRIFFKIFYKKKIFYHPRILKYLTEEQNIMHLYKSTENVSLFIVTMHCNN